MTNFIAWLLLGALVGWVASMIMKTNAQMGAIANIVVGIIGAYIGGFISNMFFGSSPDEFSLGGFIVAVLGAVLLIWIVQLMTGRRSV